MPEHRTTRKQETKFKSIRALARALDRSPSTICNWVRHDEWEFSRRPPWHLGELADMLAWSARTLRRSVDTIDEPDRFGSRYLHAEKMRLSILALVYEYQLKRIKADDLAKKVEKILVDDWRIGSNFIDDDETDLDIDPPGVLPGGGWAGGTGHSADPPAFQKPRTKDLR